MVQRKNGSLRTADAFPVVFQRERGDDRKCVCCSQAKKTGERPGTSLSSWMGFRRNKIYFRGISKEKPPGNNPTLCSHPTNRSENLMSRDFKELNNTGWSSWETLFSKSCSCSCKVSSVSFQHSSTCPQIGVMVCVAASMISHYALQATVPLATFLARRPRRLAMIVWCAV